MLKTLTKFSRITTIFVIATFLPITNVMISTSNASSPTFISVSQSSGLIPGGETVTITGTDFAAGVVVKFGGVEATGVVVNSAISITAVTPAGVAGVTNILIINTDSGTATGTGAYTYISTTIQAAGAGGSNWTHKCPSVVDTFQSTQPAIYGFTFNAWGQVFSRLVNGGSTAVTSPENLVGCYANLWDFDADPVGTNSWQIGSINRDANGYYWRQAEGPVWRLTLSGSLLTTDRANPYYSVGNSFIFLNSPAESRALTIDSTLTARNQAIAAQAERMIVEAETRLQVAANLESGLALTSQQLMGAGFISLSVANLAKVNAELRLLPINQRDISDVTRLVNLYSVVEKVSATQNFIPNDLVKAGFIPAKDPAATNIANALKSLPANQRDTPEKIAEIIATTKKTIADKQARIAALRARNLR